MKGVSAVIAIILILMIVVALAALAWTWFSGIFDQLTTSAEGQITQQQDLMSKNFVLENVDCSGALVRVSLRNSGLGDLDSTQVAIYRNDLVVPTPASSCTDDVISEGEVCQITATAGGCASTDVVKVTIESGLSHTKIIA